jgi:hypothetical protein
MMTRFLAVLLSFALAFTGVPAAPARALADDAPADVLMATASGDELQRAVYRSLVDALGDDYYVEDVQVRYVSQEYVEELTFNSQENVYFGYTLGSIEQYFSGERYVFTVDDDGQTTVQAFEAYDDTHEKVLRDVAVGAGAIIVCATVSLATGGVAPAVSLVFAASAEAGAVTALSSAAVGGCIAGLVTGVQTGDVDEALRAAELSAAEEFKWGALLGCVTGGVIEGKTLLSETKNGLTLNEAAVIQKTTDWSPETIARIKSAEEADLYKRAGLHEVKVGDVTALVRDDIDLTYVSELSDGTKVTNLERMQLGLAPIDPATGISYQLHHVNQEADGVLAVLTRRDHLGNAKVLNTKDKIGVHNEANELGISLSEWTRQREAFWKAYAQMVG